MIPFWPIVAPRLLGALSFVIDIGGMTAWPFVLSSSPMDPVTLRHEGTHAIQQFECSMLQLLGVVISALVTTPWTLAALPVVFFAGGPLYWLLYYGNYCINLLRYPDGASAYENIVFEREAYDNEGDEGYNRRRPLFAWIGR